MGRKPGIQYRLGSFWRQDDRSGFTVRADKTRKEWTGILVDEKIWEPRNAQDFVKGVPDDQTVPEARPLPPDRYSGPIYIALSANAAIGATFITLGSIAGLSAGDRVGIMLDVGVYFKTTINGAPLATGVNITTGLPSKASLGNLLVDYEA